MARTPPVAPFQASALTVPETVALVYCGTRITWKVRWPVELVAAAATYELSRPPPEPPTIVTVPPPVATALAARTNS